MRLADVPRLYWIAGGAVALTAVGAIAWARAASAASAPSREPGGMGSGSPGGRPVTGLHTLLAVSPAQVAGGGPAGSTKTDEETMKTPGLGYTTWFTLETEGEVISRLQAWRNSRNIASCKKLKTYDPDFGVTYWYQEQEAAQATQDVLADLYPTGRPWTPDARDPLSPIYGLDPQLVRIWRIDYNEDRDAPADWRRWLFLRVYYLALYHVCDYVPVT